MEGSSALKEMNTPPYLIRFKYPHLILEPSRGKDDFDGELVDCFKIVLDYDSAVGEPYRKNDFYYATYTGYDGESYRCGLLRSEDLLNWERLGIILDVGNEEDFDWGSAGGGVAFKWKGEFYMFYTGYPLKGYENGPGKMGLALSSDLFHWRKIGMVIKPDERFEWEAGGLYQPFPLLHSDRFYLFYNAKNSEASWTEQIGVAFCRGEGLLKWEKYPNNPVLQVGLPGSWDSRFVSDPSRRSGCQW